MIYKQNPREVPLFSRFDDLLSPAALKALNEGWQGIFRRTILSLLPVERVEKNFSEVTGRPTKELYSVCGLLLLMEYFGWSMETARLNYMVDLGVQYALNIEQNQSELSERSLYRYIKLLREKSWAQEVMVQVTETLLQELNLDIKEQRLDSTHVFSNMATWSRRQLLYKIIRRFLVQVKRHAPIKYRALKPETVQLYEQNNGWIFGESSPMKLNRRGKVFTAEEHLGYDMQCLLEKFASDPQFNHTPTYADMARVFAEQFVVRDGKAELNPHPGSRILLNPSDREAEIGHKGAGYQVQIAETCSENNPVQLITAAIPQGAGQSDQNSLPEVLDKLKNEGHLPEKLFADAGYGCDANFVKAASQNVCLAAPAPPAVPGRKGLDECEFDKNGIMLRCPAGNKPMFKEFRNGFYRAVFFIDVCNHCPFKEICRSERCGKKNRQFKYQKSDLRSVCRRKLESTENFKREYGKKRVPIEGLNGRLKQFTPLRRLRVRGRLSVCHSILAILTMHNIMQMVRYCRKNGKIAAEALAEAVFSCFGTIWSRFSRMKADIPGFFGHMCPSL